MKKFFLLFSATILLILMGYAQEVQSFGSRAQFGTYLYSFQTIDGGYISVGSDGNYFYTATWLGSNITRHNMDGADPLTFTIPGVSALRDITYDGTYFYAVNATMQIFKIDFANQVLIATISATCPDIAELRHIAYDPTLNGGNGGFWVGSGEALRTVNMSGMQLAAHFSTSEFWMTGSVYDPYSDPANPCLWIMTQFTTGHAIVRHFNINTQALTSYSYSVGNDHPECMGNPGGGMTSYIDKNKKFRVAADVQTSPNRIMIYGLADLMNPAAPAPVTNLTANPGASGALNATISWTNPNQTYSGQPLIELTAVKIYEDNTLIHTVSNPPIGGQSSYIATVSAPGYYTFTVVPENSHGIGTLTSVTTTWIGHDVPAAPTNPTFVIDNIEENESWTVTVSWNAPTAGLHGGYFTPPNLVYDVYRMPENNLVSESQASTTFTEIITAPGTYYYSIKAKNHIGDGGSCATSSQDLCWSIYTFPWEEKFLTSLFPPVCWKRYTLQGTVNWQNTMTTYFSSPFAAQVWSYEQGARETWLITPEIFVPETGNIVLDFQSKVNFDLYYGSSEVWVSTESNDPASGTFVMLKQLVSGVDFNSTADWRQIVVPLETYLGTNIYIGFRYFNNNYNDHHAWFIDDITIKDKPAVDAKAKKLYGSLTPMVNEPFLFKAVIENAGSIPLTNYTVKLIDENDNVLAVSNTTLPVIAPTETAIIPIYWTPTSDGELTLHALVEATGDANPLDNTSPPLEVLVNPYNEIFTGKAGNGTDFQMTVPFAFMMVYSFAQTLFYDHDIIGRAGTITKVQYFSNFSMPLTRDVKIWMANTTQNAFEDWMPESEFTLVFEGEVLFPAGMQTVTITLDEPFVYTGNNLAIMSRPIGPGMPSMGLKSFYVTTTPDFPARSNFFMSNFFDFEWGMGGSLLNYHPNIVFTIAAQAMGSVSGTVTSDGTTPVEGAMVEIVGVGTQRITDANGFYSYDHLIPGDYQFKASKQGYNDAISGSITVTANENSVVDLTITPYNTFTLSGKVTGNDAPAGLANVEITVSGYQTYTATTNASGDYQISDIYGGHTYNIKAVLQGYQQYNSTVEISNANAVHDIMLHETADPVVFVKAEKVADNVVVTWNEPGSGSPKIYRYDSGASAGQLGWPDGTRISIIGAAHKDAKAELRSLSWYSTYDYIQPAYDLWILGLNDEGKPDRSKVLLLAKDIPNTPTVWCKYVFPMPVSVLDGFFMGVSPSQGGFTSIGTDIPNENYPFTLNTNLFSYDYDEEWTCFSADGFFVNAMIRAEGVSFGKNVQFGYSDEKPEHTPPLSTYSVYRMLDSEQGNEAAWTQLATNLSGTTYTDAAWTSLDPEIYRYAIKAEYTGGVLSAARISNAVSKDMEFPFTVNLTANSGDPVVGALVTLTNLDGNPAHVYKKTANSGTIPFPLVWKGSYKISIKLSGYHPYSASNIEITQNGLSHNAELEEIMVKPFRLIIEETGNDGERLFSWNNSQSTTYIWDDGTGEDGYAINAGWDFLLGNKFDVGEEGYINSIDIFGMHNPLIDIFGNRTVTVDIYDEQQNFVGKSDPFYLASDDWSNIPVDALSYSGVFYAMVHWYTNGSEPTNFLGIDSNGPNADKNYDMLFDGMNWEVAHIGFQDIPFVFMIRVNAESTGLVKSVTYGHNVTGITGHTLQSFSSSPLQLSSSSTLPLLCRIENPVPVNAESKYVVQHPKSGAAKSKLGYHVYLDSEEKANNISETEFLFTSLAKGNYTAGVKSVYTSGVSEMVTIDFEVKECNIIDHGNNLENVVLFPNPFTNEINISYPELVKNIQITDIIGQQIKEVTFNGKTIQCGSLSSGVYFVELESFSGERKIYKLVKKG